MVSLAVLLPYHRCSFAHTKKELVDRVFIIELCFLWGELFDFVFLSWSYFIRRSRGIQNGSQLALFSTFLVYKGVLSSSVPHADILNVQVGAKFLGWWRTCPIWIAGQVM